MPLNSKQLQYIIGSEETAADMVNALSLAPFEEKTLEFFNDLSRMLLKNGREYSDVMTFGFWCRKASLESMKKTAGDLSGRLGNGIVFHSTPSNVPVNFAFSFAAGLLAGNANIVRLPARDFPQVGIICDGIVELLEDKHEWLKPYVCFIKYPPDKALHDLFSWMCDVRVVWGGDATIAELRRSPLRPRAIEINFADRHSICVIDADEYLALDEKEKEKAALDFYNDTYFSDQNACTAPRLVVWTGSNKDTTKEQFWSRLEAIVAERYTFLPAQATGKLAAFCQLAAVKSGVSLMKSAGNMLWRIRLENLPDDLMEYKYSSGFFFEYDTEQIEEILPVCGKACQTVSYLGFAKERIWDEMLAMRPKGIDRIVPVGKTMDFSLVWDGYDLIRLMSREIGVT